MTLNFSDETFDVSKGLEPSGGGGTSDHAQLTNLDYASSGHTGFLSSADFLPDGTKITVDSNGTGDFTTIQDAISFLSGKWSNGVVTISLGEGTFNTQYTITIDGKNNGIKYLQIEGSGINTTTVVTSTTDTYLCIFNNQNVILKNITFARATKDGKRGIIAQNNSYINIANVKVKNCTYAFAAYQCAKVEINSNLQIEDGEKGLVAEIGGFITSTWQCAVSFKNCTYAFWISINGFMAFGDITPTYTNVTNHANIAMNQMTNQGYILGAGT